MLKHHIVLLIFLLVCALVIAGASMGFFSFFLLLPVFFLFSLIIALGSANIRWNYFMNSTNKMKSSSVYLTFDDGPVENTNKVLDILKREHVLATFFLIGKQVDLHPEITKRILNEGHSIGNHSYTHHASLDFKSTDFVVKDFIKANNSIEAVTGLKPHLFRPPFGVTNPNIAAAVKKLNFHSIGWSIRTKDTIAKNKAELLKKLEKIEGGDIILLHDRVELTAETLPEIIYNIRSKGYNFDKII